MSKEGKSSSIKFQFFYLGGESVGGFVSVEATFTENTEIFYREEVPFGEVKAYLKDKVDIRPA